MKNIKVGIVLEKAEWYAELAKEHASAVDMLSEDRTDWLMCTRYIDMYSALVQLVYGFDKGLKMEEELANECLNLRK